MKEKNMAQEIYLIDDDNDLKKKLVELFKKEKEYKFKKVKAKVNLTNSNQKNNLVCSKNKNRTLMWILKFQDIFTHKYSTLEIYFCEICFVCLFVFHYYIYPNISA